MLSILRLIALFTILSLVQAVPQPDRDRDRLHVHGGSDSRDCYFDHSRASDAVGWFKSHGYDCKSTGSRSWDCPRRDDHQHHDWDKVKSYCDGRSHNKRDQVDFKIGCSDGYIICTVSRGRQQRTREALAASGCHCDNYNCPSGDGHDIAWAWNQRDRWHCERFQPHSTRKAKFDIQAKDGKIQCSADWGTARSVRDNLTREGFTCSPGYGYERVHYCKGDKPLQTLKAKLKQWKCE